MTYRPYDPIPLLWSFRGTIGRRQFLAGMAYLWGVGFIILLVVAILELPGAQRGFAALVGLAAIMPSSAICAKRMRDYGMHWMWLLVGHAAILVGGAATPIGLGIVGFTGTILTWICVATMIAGGLIMFCISLCNLFMPGRFRLMLDRSGPNFVEKNFLPRVGS